jgi:hypothetical protein
MLERFHMKRNRNRSSIFALSHFRRENRIPPIAREDGRKRPDASAGAGIFLKMLQPQNACSGDQFQEARGDGEAASSVQAWLMAPVSMLVTSAFGRSRNSD